MGLVRTDAGDAAVAAEARAREAILRHGARPLSLKSIGAFPGLKRAGRYCFRVECEDGVVLKAREIGDVGESRALAEHRAGLDPAFVPILRLDGSVLVEAWVEGIAVDLATATDRAEAIGALLGGAHSSTLVPGETSTAAYLEEAHADIARLGEDGSLDAAECVAIEGLIAALDPESFRPVLVHRDYCPENFVVDPAGELHVVDNEWFEPGAAGFDLNRSFNRWPMSAAVRSRFLAGYGRLAEVPGSLEFWNAVEALSSARIYRRVAPPRAEPFLATLRGLLRDASAIG
jgi:Ser/Thr protein kinase RdoA (MazF antagonist)